MSIIESQQMLTNIASNQTRDRLTNCNQKNIRWKLPRALDRTSYVWFKKRSFL